jgi:hypothetical protein
MLKLTIAAGAALCAAILFVASSAEASSSGDKRGTCWEYGSFGWGYYWCSAHRTGVRAVDAGPSPDEPLCTRWDWPHGWGMFGCVTNIWRAPGWGHEGWF